MANSMKNHLQAYGLRNEGKGYGWSAIAEDGRMVFGSTIKELHRKMFGI